VRHKLECDTKAWLDALTEDGRARYGRALQAIAISISQHAAHGSAPDVVARAVVHTLTSRRPRTRYPVAAGAKRLLFMRGVLPRPGARPDGDAGGRPAVRLTSEPVVECSECFAEGAFEPGGVVGFAVVVGGEGVVPSGCGVAYVVAGAGDEGAHVVESVGVGHGPGSTAADVDG
jgi:hypothetical protein